MSTLDRGPMQAQKQVSRKGKGRPDFRSSRPFKGGVSCRFLECARYTCTPFRRFRAQKPNPTRPEPMSSNDAGSGTVEPPQVVPPVAVLVDVVPVPPEAPIIPVQSLPPVTAAAK